MKTRKRLKRRSAAAYALMRTDLPFRHRVEPDKKKFKRHPKHKSSLL